MDIAKHTTIKQDIYKKQNCPYPDGSCHWLYAVCRCVFDTVPVSCHLVTHTFGCTGMLFGVYRGTRNLYKLLFSQI